MYFSKIWRLLEAKFPKATSQIGQSAVTIMTYVFKVIYNAENV